MIVRKVVRHSDTEDMYRVTIFRKIESFDELLVHPEIASLIDQRVTRVEKIDNFRFKVFVQRTDERG